MGLKSIPMHLNETTRGATFPFGTYTFNTPADFPRCDCRTSNMVRKGELLTIELSIKISIFASPWVEWIVLTVP